MRPSGWTAIKKIITAAIASGRLFTDSSPKDRSRASQKKIASEVHIEGLSKAFWGSQQSSPSLSASGPG